jgi:glycosyltransferase involved in cell wall biosynthesis
MENPKKDIKVLVVAEAASVHTAKYITVLQSLGYRVQLFSNSPNSYQDELLKNLTIYVGGGLTLPPVNGNTFMVPAALGWVKVTEKHGRKYFKILKVLKRYILRRHPVRALQGVIDKFLPDVIISLKMQNDGYVMAEARAESRVLPQPPWAHFIWGTDIEFFGKDPGYRNSHLSRIKQVLKYCDYIIADTSRDLIQAKDFGFQGTLLGKQIAQGGFDMDFVTKNNKTPFGERKIILVKGRQGGLIGKGMNILEVLHELRDLVRGYEIKIIMATPDVRERALEYSRTDNIFYDCTDRMSYVDLMLMFSKARLAISATDVDGSPGFLLEAMAMGALPVHSDMESIREWITHGHNGLLFPVDSKDALKEMIMKGLESKELFDKAYKVNASIALEKMDQAHIRLQTKDMINLMLNADKSIQH